jgi:hypothetical protein
MSKATKLLDSLTEPASAATGDYVMTTSIAPAFVRNITNADNPIIRVNETPDEYISIHGVEYLEERPEEGEEADWQQLSEKYLRKDSETTLLWLGHNQQTTSGDFPDAIAYRVQGEEQEYTKAEILDLINSWDASFSGYTYWNGHNWVFQHTSDELGEWFGVELELTEVANHEGQGWGATSLYVGTRGGETDYYLGTSHSGGERLQETDLTTLASDADFKQEVRELLYEAANTHLAYPEHQQRAAHLAQQEQRNLFAERCTLAELVELLAATGEEVTEESLEVDFATNGTVL